MAFLAAKCVTRPSSGTGTAAACALSVAATNRVAVLCVEAPARASTSSRAASSRRRPRPPSTPAVDGGEGGERRHARGVDGVTVARRRARGGRRRGAGARRGLQPAAYGVSNPALSSVSQAQPYSQTARTPFASIVTYDRSTAATARAGPWEIVGAVHVEVVAAARVALYGRVALLMVLPGA